MDNWVERIIAFIALAFVALLIPLLVIAGLKAFTALDCYAKKDPTNFSCYYSKGRNIKFEDIPK